MHRLVAIGDSLTQGFKSGSILETNLSYPAILAWEMGLGEDEFRYPAFAGHGGLPLNIEYVLRRLDREFGEDVDWYELPLAAFHLRRWMDEIEDYWERGPGAAPLKYSGPYHNLAVWGFEIQDAYQLTAAMCQAMTEKSTDDWLRQVPEYSMFRTALRVLNPSGSQAEAHRNATQISRARQLALDGGIENLVVFLGANNVLGTVTSLQCRESAEKDAATPNPANRRANFYRLEDYDVVLSRLVEEVEKLGQDGGRVERVFWGTVPPVTIPPVTRGVGGRMDGDQGLPSPYGDGDDPRWFRRYFRYYTRPWIPEKRFDPREDPHLPGVRMMEIDHRIARYNELLQEKVRLHNDRRRAAGHAPDWLLVDLHQVLERLAYRRYREDLSVPPPPGWSPYELPEALEALELDTRFLMGRQGKRIRGGFFSLDGIHPTTAGYGLVAQEFINVMQAAGVPFYWGDGKTPRQPPVRVDFGRLVRLDSLMGRLPATLDDMWERLEDGDQLLDLFKRAFAWAR